MVQFDLPTLYGLARTSEGQLRPRRVSMFPPSYADRAAQRHLQRLMLRDQRAREGAAAMPAPAGSGSGSGPATRRSTVVAAEGSRAAPNPGGGRRTSATEAVVQTDQRYCYHECPLHGRSEEPVGGAGRKMAEDSKDKDKGRDNANQNKGKKAAAAKKGKGKGKARLEEVGTDDEDDEAEDDADHDNDDDEGYGTTRDDSKKNKKNKAAGAQKNKKQQPQEEGREKDKKPSKTEAVHDGEYPPLFPTCPFPTFEPSGPISSPFCNLGQSHRPSAPFPDFETPLQAHRQRVPRARDIDYRRQALESCARAADQTLFEARGMDERYVANYLAECGAAWRQTALDWLAERDLRRRTHFFPLAEPGARAHHYQGDAGRYGANPVIAPEWDILNDLSGKRYGVPYAPLHGAGPQYPPLAAGGGPGEPVVVYQEGDRMRTADGRDVVTVSRPKDQDVHRTVHDPGWTPRASGALQEASGNPQQPMHTRQHHAPPPRKVYGENNPPRMKPVHVGQDNQAFGADNRPPSQDGNQSNRFGWNNNNTYDNDALRNDWPQVNDQGNDDVQNMNGNNFQGGQSPASGNVDQTMNIHW